MSAKRAPLSSNHLKMNGCNLTENGDVENRVIRSHGSNTSTTEMYLYLIFPRCARPSLKIKNGAILHVAERKEMLNTYT